MTGVKETLYTLVQHSAYGYAQDPGFRRAVEERGVTGAEIEKVRKAGGLLFDTYKQASDAGDYENYPPEVGGMYPRARGGFSRTKVDGLAVYVPARVTS